MIKNNDTREEAKFLTINRYIIDDRGEFLGCLFAMSLNLKPVCILGLIAVLLGLFLLRHGEDNASDNIIWS